MTESDPLYSQPASQAALLARLAEKQDAFEHQKRWPTQPAKWIAGRPCYSRILLDVLVLDYSDQ